MTHKLEDVQENATKADEPKINMLVGNHIKGNYNAWSESALFKR